uniref:Cuticle protein n=1 Tax=Stomoxys calcitrans TaxID=35570 RepID=A0A1I8PER0_STOCA
MNSNYWRRLLAVWALLICTVYLEIPRVTASDQYHIQTDEGPERYFRFQTNNGQFRKEKRLQDGTVIGTEAWIDAAGYLRLKDYIADKQGYRILKNKVLYVGQGTAIEDAIKSTKSIPAQSGILVDGKNGLHGSSRANSISSDSSSGRLYVPVRQTPAPTAVPTTTEKPILGYISPAEAGKLDQTPYLGFDHYPNEKPSEDHNSSHEGDQLSPQNPLIVVPSIEMAPPVESRRRRPIRPIAIAPINPAPISANDVGRSADSGYHYSTPAPFVTAAPKAGYYYGPASVSQSHNHPPQSLPYDVNALEGGLLPPLPPLYQRRRVPVAQGGYGTRLVAPEYNDVTVTRNGFRYVLPHQYHEEEQLNESKKAGSFGYVDPFGIRRVVYYNASPQKGFIHRNHNQYVGLGATPYDEPQPQAEAQTQSEV